MKSVVAGEDHNGLVCELQSVERVEKLRVKTAVYFSLAIPQCLFETPVPEGVLRRLQPSAWKEHLLTQWIAKAGIFNPNERKFSRIGYILFNSLLYDSLVDLWRGTFPEAAWMRKRYGFRSDLLLPYYHCARISNLLFRRLKT